MLPWSVTARLSMPSFLTCATSSGIRLAPSSNEYSLWVWRWTKAMRYRLPRAASSLPDGVQRDTASLQQHQKMIEEIGRLGRETLGLLRIRRDDHLDRLLAHLLRDLGDTPRSSSSTVYEPLGPLRGPRARWWRPDGVSRWPPGSSPATAAPSGPTAVEKQVRAPVWQAGPVCSTR